MKNKKLFIHFLVNITLTPKTPPIILCLLATLPVGFSRPYLPNAHEKVSLFCGHPYVSPSAAEREGDIFGCADFWVNQSANPFSFRHHNHLAVMWRNFFITQRSPLCVLFLLYWLLPKSLYSYHSSNL